MTPELATLTIAEVAARIKTGAVSPVELTELYLQRIEKLDPVLNAFVTVIAEDARSQAKVAGKGDQRQESIVVCSMGYLLPSRTISQPRGSELQPGPRSFPIGCPILTLR